MFAHHFRRAALALALAGATLVATSLMTSIAAAAPADSSPLPATAETESASAIIKIPVSDAAVSFRGSWATSNGGRTFAFHVVNNGPSTATITIKKTLYRGYCLDPNAPSCHVGTDITQKTIELQSGGSHETVINCSYSKCGTMVEVKAENRIDPNSENNSVANWNFFSE